MNKYIKSLGFTLFFIIILTLLVTFLNYIGLISGTFLNIIKFIIPVISVFIGGFVIGNNSTEKGWLNGLKIGFVIIVLFLIISLLFKSKIDFKVIIYYLILLGIVVFGSMIGISKRKE